MDSFEDLKGKTIAAITGATPGSELIIFTLDDGSQYIMWHGQDCCESVSVDDVVGDVSDLIGYPLLMAEEVISCENPEGVEVPEFQDSFTWTFYKLATVRGYVTIRWYGESNGYYSETVSFGRVDN